MMVTTTTQPMENNIERLVPFLKVSDIERSVRYYVDGLGFVMKNSWVHEGQLRWCWLEVGGAALMLQEFAREGLDSWQPKGKVGEGVSLVFICADALAVYRQALARGLQPTEPEVGNSMWVTSVSDPDGYRMEFESVTDVAEDTKLSEIEGPIPTP